MTFGTWALLGLTAALFGASFSLLNIAVADLSPLHLAAARVAVAALILVGFAQATGRRLPSEISAWRHLVVLGLLMAAVPYIGIAWGQARIDASLGGILFATIPVFTALLAPFMGAEPPLRGAQYIGLALGFVGVLCAIGPQALSHMGGQALGAAVTLLAAASYALGTLYARRHSTLDPVGLSAGQMLAGAVILLPLAAWFGGPVPRQLAPETVWATLAVGSVSTALPVVLMFGLIQRIGATQTSLLTYFIPIFSVLIGVLFLGDVLTALNLVGFALIIAGAAWFSHLAKRPKPKERANVL